MARKTSGPRLVDGMEGSEEARKRLRVILETLTGERSVIEAAGELGVSEARFHEMRKEALQAAIGGLEPGVSGRPRERTEKDERLEELEEVVKELQIELRASQVREEIAITMPHLLKPHLERGKKPPLELPLLRNAGDAGTTVPTPGTAAGKKKRDRSGDGGPSAPGGTAPGADA